MIAVRADLDSRNSRWLKKNALALIAVFVALNLTVMWLLHITRSAADMYWRLMVRDGEAEWAIPFTVVVLTITIVLDDSLRARNSSLLEWSPWHLKANIAELPIGLKYVGWLYVVLLGFCVPVMAWLEECLFRWQTASTWTLGLVIGVLGFAAFHIFAAVSVRMMVCMAFVGGMLVMVYMMAGFWSAFLVHTTFNFLAIAWVTYELKIKPRIAKRRQRRALARTQLDSVKG